MGLCGNLAVQESGQEHHFLVIFRAASIRCEILSLIESGTHCNMVSRFSLHCKTTSPNGHFRRFATTSYPGSPPLPAIRSLVASYGGEEEETLGTTGVHKKISARFPSLDLFFCVCGRQYAFT